MTLCYTRPLPERIRMLDLLTEELAKAGLHLNVKTTKPLTNDAPRQHHDTPCFVETHGGMLEVLPNMPAYKYLGRHICGHSQNRGTLQDETETRRHKKYLKPRNTLYTLPSEPQPYRKRI